MCHSDSTVNYECFKKKYKYNILHKYIWNFPYTSATYISYWKNVEESQAEKEWIIQYCYGILIKPKRKLNHIFSVTYKKARNATLVTDNDKLQIIGNARTVKIIYIHNSGVN